MKTDNFKKQKGYGIGIFIFMLMSHYEKTQRLGSPALFFNRLQEVDHFFIKRRIQHKQKVVDAIKKNKKLPKPSQALVNYDIASIAAQKAWEDAVRERNGKIDLTISGVISGFWIREHNILSLLYNFTESDFKMFNKENGVDGYYFSGLKTANLLMSKLEDQLISYSNNEKNIQNNQKQGERI